MSFNKQGNLTSNQVKTLTNQLYSDLFLEFAPEKIAIIFDKELLFKFEFIKVPLEIYYTPDIQSHSVGCREYLENTNERFSFYFLANNKKESISEKEVLMLKETLITCDTELEELETAVEKIYNILYYYFENFDFKLNGVTLNFIRVPIVKEIEFICFFKLLDNTLDLIDIETGQQVSNVDLLKRIYNL